MNNPPRFLRALVPAALALGLASCVYDPYAYYGDYYSTPVVSGAVFVSTADPWWGYDPYRYCYYDYRRSCYYDPWLSCYYPTGYIPRPIVGCPHPYSWRPGHGVCPAPRNPSNRYDDGRHDRLAALRATNHSWARQVQVNDQSLQSHMRQNPQAWQHRVERRTPSAALAGTPQTGGDTLPTVRRGRYDQGRVPYGGSIQPPPAAGIRQAPFRAGEVRQAPPSYRPQSQGQPRGTSRSRSVFDTPVSTPAPHQAPAARVARTAPPPTAHVDRPAPPPQVRQAPPPEASQARAERSDPSPAMTRSSGHHRESRDR